VLAGCGSGSEPDKVSSVPPQSTGTCAPGESALEWTGSAASTDARTYREIPFEVAAGTGRIELSYGWTEKPGLPSTPLTSTTFDLGLWDQHGYRSATGFRGWSGSRQGRIDNEQPPIFVEAGQAERGYVPGAIEPGTWYADLGIAAVSPQGADWIVRVECKSAGGSTPANDPVDRTHIARFAPGWYHGDFHMHGYHSNSHAPDWDDFVAQARAAQLDFLMVTEYVTGQHWRTLGAVQRAYPDLLIWPGREIITYFGHVTGHGETPDVLEYRHGFEDVNIGEIQRQVKAGGALFQVNHPTIFPPPLFSNFCRGCYFELANQIDWNQVDTIELQNGPPMVNSSDLGLPEIPVEIENPFTTTAILMWDDLLRRGHKITGVSGSDSKGVDAPEDRARKGYGSSATAVYADSLSRDALAAAIKAGHAYIQVRGVADSPTLEFEAFGLRGQHGIFGDTLPVIDLESVTLRTTVTGGAGQLLLYFQNGLPLLVVPILTDPFVHEFPLAIRNPLTEGPLGTYWRVETRDLKSRTTIGNPIFLKDE
jgi:hypothetical protein